MVFQDVILDTRSSVWYDKIIIALGFRFAQQI